jgi:hypothetical protein
MGVNVHMEYNTTAPYNNYAGINQKLEALGMRHFRDEMNHADPTSQFYDPRFVKEIQKIGMLGYTLCGVIEGGNDYPASGRLEASGVIPMVENLLPAIGAVEGPNEPDGGGFVYDGSGYPQGAIEESEDLWTILRGSSDFTINSLPILGMSEASAPDFKKLARITGSPFGDADYGNMHAYQGGELGNGLGQSSLAGWYIPFAQDWTGSKPLWTTEMGYHNDTNYLSDGEQQGVSQRATAIYLPIAFLSGFNLNVGQTYSYELIDEVADPPLASCPGKDQSRCTGSGYYGLLNYDFTPKPAYTALANLIALLRDPGVGFQPGSLELEFSDAPKTMHYTLLEKSDGDYYLAVWNDISVYKIAECTEWNQQTQVCMKSQPGQDLYPPDARLTITLTIGKSFTVYAPNDSTGVKPTAAYTVRTDPDSITLKLPPQVLLVKISDR